MRDIKFFCLTLDPDHEELIKKLSYIPVGLGNKKFSKECFNDKEGQNISNKNSYYGEYTFHYWIWKNYLDKIESNWVGFCQYRKFFFKKITLNKNIDFDTFNSYLTKRIENTKENFDCILGNKFSVTNYKLSKIFKNHFYSFASNPRLFFSKKKKKFKISF
tara:strand:+ start:452 stop:934 length:483 start_codon:yes stop_codon:yes gene_type:complete